MIKKAIIPALFALILLAADTTFMTFVEYLDEYGELDFTHSMFIFGVILGGIYLWKSTALFTLFGFWMQTKLAGFAGCQKCRKARRSRMVLDNLRKLLNHHAAKKRKLSSLKKCKQRDLFQHLKTV